MLLPQRAHSLVTGFTETRAYRLGGGSRRRLAGGAREGAAVHERLPRDRRPAAPARLVGAAVRVEGAVEVARLDQLVTFTLLGMSDPVRVHANRVR